MNLLIHIGINNKRGSDISKKFKEISKHYDKKMINQFSYAEKIAFFSQRKMLFLGFVPASSPAVDSYFNLDRFFSSFYINYFLFTVRIGAVMRHTHLRDNR